MHEPPPRADEDAFDGVIASVKDRGDLPRRKADFLGEVGDEYIVHEASPGVSVERLHGGRFRMQIRMFDTPRLARGVSAWLRPSERSLRAVFV